MFATLRQIEIQFGDCDPAGIVYYPNYFRFADTATAGLISEALGMHKRAWLAEFGSAGIPMVETNGRFLKPNRFGDLVTVHSEITALGRSSFGVQHHFERDGDLTLEITEKRVWTKRDGAGGITSATLPDPVRAALEMTKD